MKKLLTISTVLVSLVLPTTVKAGEIDASTSIHSVDNTQINRTEQESVGVVNQTAVYSVGQAATYRIDSIVCPSPALISSGNVNSHGDFTVSAAIVVPLGGRKNDYCNGALQARSEFYQMSNQVNTALECANLIQAGIVLDPEKFPTLSNYCEGVTIND